jgi:hypothetical protein
MILLDSAEILAAVRRSLEVHVLPELRDEFARVQVQSALKALAEVAERDVHRGVVRAPPVAAVRSERHVLQAEERRVRLGEADPTAADPGVVALLGKDGGARERGDEKQGDGWPHRSYSGSDQGSASAAARHSRTSGCSQTAAA